jgi:hypothetical protein
MTTNLYIASYPSIAGNFIVGMPQQRHIGWTSNGKVWITHWALSGISTGTGTIAFQRNDFNGDAPWTGVMFKANIPVGINNAHDWSMFIDQDDYMHIVFRMITDSYKMYYTRGTPNADRTDYTFSAVVQVKTNSSDNSDAGKFEFPNMVVHREGTGWRVHMVCSHRDSGGQRVMYKNWSISSGGVPSSNMTTVGVWSAINTNTPANNWATYPSIDFHHTGDTKTILDGTPHVYVSWVHAGVQGTVYGIKYRKANWAAGPTWTWASEVQVASDMQVPTNLVGGDVDNTPYWVQGQWLGEGANRYSIGGMLWNSGGGVTAGDGGTQFLHEVTGTNTVTTVMFSAGDRATRMWHGAGFFDAEGNFWYSGQSTYQNGNARPRDVAIIDRQTGYILYRTTLSTISTVDRPEFMKQSRNGWNHLFWQFTSSDGAHHLIRSDFIANIAPNAPVLTYPSNNGPIDRTQVQMFTWNFSDPNSGNTQGSYEIRARVSGTSPWTVTAGPTNSSQSQHIWSANTFSANTWEWQVRTSDNSGATGPWSTSSFFVASTAPSVNITKPTSNEVIATNFVNVEWTIAGTQQQWYVMGYEGVGTSGNVVYDSDTQIGTAKQDAFLVNNNTTYTVAVMAMVGGLWSPWATRTFSTSYALPANPTITAVYHDAFGLGFNHSIKITGITNPTPIGAQPIVNTYDIWVREVGKPETAIKLMSGASGSVSNLIWYSPKSGVAYEFATFMYANNLTESYSTWQAPTGTQVRIPGFLVHDSVVPTQYVHMPLNDSGATDDMQMEAAVVTLQGREFPIAEYGDAVTRTIEVSLANSEGGTSSDALRALVRRRSVVCYRDSKGRRVFGVTFGHSESDAFWGKRTGLSLTQVEGEDVLH